MYNQEVIPFPALKNEILMTADDEKQKKEIQDFINPENLVDIFKIHNICLFASKAFGILRRDLEIFNKKLEELFGFTVALDQNFRIRNRIKVKKFNNGQELLEHFQKIKQSRFDWRFKKRIQKHAVRRNRVKQCYPEFSAINHDVLNHNVLCLDMEFYPHDEIRITEIGFVFWEKGEPEYKHYLIKEYKGLKKDCRTRPNNQQKFAFGETEVISIHEVKELLLKYIQKTKYFIGHSAHSENFYLQGLGIDLVKHVDYVIDTQNIHMNMTDDIHPIALGKLLKFMDIPFKDLHNAGNDAVYTWQIFRKQLEIID